MKQYKFKFEHIKLDVEFLGRTYSNVLKSACFQSKSYPTTNNNKIINHAFDFANQFIKDTWVNFYNTSYKVTVEYPVFESDVNTPKFEINKTLTINPDNINELDSNERKLFYTACNKLYKSLPENYLKTAGFDPGCDFFDKKYVWTDGERTMLWSPYVAELQITLISIN